MHLYHSGGATRPTKLQKKLKEDPGSAKIAEPFHAASLVNEQDAWSASINTGDECRRLDAANTIDRTAGQRNAPDSFPEQDR
jgi:hypothetical protein